MRVIYREKQITKVEKMLQENNQAKREYTPGGYRQVWILSYPIVITMISQTIMGLASTIMLGRLSTAQLGAAGLGGIIMWTFFSFFNGLLSSANTFIAQDYGAKEYKNIGKMMWYYIYISIASYLLLFSLIFTINPILNLINSSAEVTSYSNTYIRIRFYSGIGVFVSFALSGFFRGIGDTKTPMYVAIISNVVNLILSYILIFGKYGFPRLEIAGASISNGIASILSGLMLFVVCLSKNNNRDYATRSFYRIELSLVRRIVWVGAPMGVQFLLDNGSFSLFSAFIARMGDAPLAANNAAISIMSTSFMPLVGISIGASILVGQYIGSKEINYAKKSGYTAIKFGFIYAGSIAACFFIFPKQLLGLVSKDADVINLGAKVLMLAGIFQISDAFGICSNGALRGAGDTRFTMLIGLSYAWFLFIPLAYFFGFTLHGGIAGAWLGATIYIILYGVTVFIRFRRGKWESIKI